MIELTVMGGSPSHLVPANGPGRSPALEHWCHPRHHWGFSPMSTLWWSPAHARSAWKELVMRKSSAFFVSAIALGLAMFVPLKASAQGVSIYIDPGYPAYGGYPPYGGYPAYDAGYPVYLAPYAYSYPTYGYARPSYRYGYGRPYYGGYWGQGRRIARRVDRRHDRW